MPVYEVRRRTVLTYSVVTAANELEARCLARDAWQQDAALSALAADVTRRPNIDTADAVLDARSDDRYDADDDSERRAYWDELAELREQRERLNP